MGHEPPMTIDVIRERFSPEARPFIIHASLRSDFLNIHESDSATRFDEELSRLFAPAAEIVETPRHLPARFSEQFRPRDF